MNRRSFLCAPVLLATSPARGEEQPFELKGAEVTLDIEPGMPESMSALIRRWLVKCADAVHLYYGRFPVPQVYVHVVPGSRPGVNGGQTFPGEMPLIRVRVGPQSMEADLMERDWVMVHEMIHLAFPWMDGRHNWMAEGLAVYVESIARLQAGHVSPVQVRGDFVRMMPRGLPQEGEGGFEASKSWGRTYWGGAMFCLVADIAIRRQTDGRLGLQHALRAINAERDFRREWDFRETLAIGDKATGTRVLISQFETMAQDPVAPDLPALWRDLGIVVDGGQMRIEDSAPLAGIRTAIETPLA